MGVAVVWDWWLEEIRYRCTHVLERKTSPKPMWLIVNYWKADRSAVYKSKRAL
jgi:hypothetical protein